MMLTRWRRRWNESRVGMWLDERVATKRKWTLGVSVAIVCLVVASSFGALRDSNEAEERSARNGALVAQLEEHRVAFVYKVCVFGNDAKRTAREDLDAAVSAVLDFLRLSPHSAAIAEQVEADIRPRMSTAAQKDHDCDGSGALDAGDYP